MPAEAEPKYFLIPSPLAPIEPMVCRYIAVSKSGLLLLKGSSEITRGGLKQWPESLQRARLAKRHLSGRIWHHFDDCYLSRIESAAQRQLRYDCQAEKPMTNVNAVSPKGRCRVTLGDADFRKSPMKMILGSYQNQRHYLLPVTRPLVPM